jgi:hypothetical protein
MRDDGLLRTGDGEIELLDAAALAAEATKVTGADDLGH